MAIISCTSFYTQLGVFVNRYHYTLWKHNYEQMLKLKPAIFNLHHKVTATSESLATPYEKIAFLKYIQVFTLQAENNDM